MVDVGIYTHTWIIWVVKTPKRTFRGNIEKICFLTDKSSEMCCAALFYPVNQPPVVHDRRVYLRIVEAFFVPLVALE